MGEESERRGGGEEKERERERGGREKEREIEGMRWGEREGERESNMKT